MEIPHFRKFDILTGEGLQFCSILLIIDLDKIHIGVNRHLHVVFCSLRQTAIDIILIRRIPLGKAYHCDICCRPRASQTCIGILQRLPVGEFSTCRIYRIRPHRRPIRAPPMAIRNTKDSLFHIIVPFHSYSSVSLIFGISIPSGQTMSVSATPSLPYIE